MFAINNCLVPKAQCFEARDTSLSLRVCVYTTIMQLFLRTVAHMRVYSLLVSMNATSGGKKERRLVTGFDGQDFTYVHRIDWSSRSEEERKNGSVRKYIHKDENLRVIAFKGLS